MSKGLHLHPGDDALTGFNGKGLIRVTILERDDTRTRSWTQSGVAFRCYPPLNGGTTATWYDSGWFEPIPTYNQAADVLEPTLADDSFQDEALAQAACVLWKTEDGKITNAVQLLVRPTDVRGDESGEHPGESFVMVTITREELRAMLNWLDEDLSRDFTLLGDPNVMVAP